MSNRITFGVVFIAALAGGAVLWQMHNQRDVSRASAAVPVTAPRPAAMPEEPKDGGAAESRGIAPSADVSRRPVDTKKTTVVADAGSPLRAGETWQYSA